MKKIFLLLLSTSLLVSCSIDDGGTPNIVNEVMEISGVDMPTEFTYNETYEISVSYVRPNGCYEFNNFIYQVDGNNRTIAVVDTVFLDNPCTQAEEQATVSFDFRVTALDTYVFRFYQGQVDNEDVYLVIEVPVNP